MGFSVNSIKQFLQLFGKEQIIETATNQMKNIRWNAVKYEPGILRFSEQLGFDVVQLNAKNAYKSAGALRQAAASGKNNICKQSIPITTVNNVRPQFIELVKKAKTPEQFAELVNSTTNTSEVEYLRKCIKQVSCKNAFGCKKNRRTCNINGKKS